MCVCVDTGTQVCDIARKAACTQLVQAAAPKRAAVLLQVYRRVGRGSISIHSPILPWTPLPPPHKHTHSSTRLALLPLCVPLRPCHLHISQQTQTLPPSGMMLSAPSGRWMAMVTTTSSCTWSGRHPALTGAEEEERRRRLNDCRNVLWRVFSGGAVVCRRAMCPGPSQCMGGRARTAFQLRARC